MPNCELRLIGLRHSNGSTYLMNVAFEADGKRVVVEYAVNNARLFSSDERCSFAKTLVFR